MSGAWDAMLRHEAATNHAAGTCRHECPECRLGLGTHLICDPHCDHHALTHGAERHTAPAE